MLIIFVYRLRGISVYLELDCNLYTCVPRESAARVPSPLSASAQKGISCEGPFPSFDWSTSATCCSITDFQVSDEVGGAPTPCKKGSTNSMPGVGVLIYSQLRPPAVHLRQMGLERSHFTCMNISVLYIDRERALHCIPDDCGMWCMQ